MARSAEWRAGHTHLSAGQLRFLAAALVADLFVRVVVWRGLISAERIDCLAGGESSHSSRESEEEASARRDN